MPLMTSPTVGSGFILWLDFTLPAKGRGGEDRANVLELEVCCLQVTLKISEVEVEDIVDDAKSHPTLNSYRSLNKT
jgi:hypothetical protein